MWNPRPACQPERISESCRKTRPGASSEGRAAAAEPCLRCEATHGVFGARFHNPFLQHKPLHRTDRAPQPQSNHSSSHIPNPVTADSLHGVLRKYRTPPSPTIHQMSMVPFILALARHKRGELESEDDVPRTSDKSDAGSKEHRTQAIPPPLSGSSPGSQREGASQRMIGWAKRWPSGGPSGRWRRS